MSLLFLSHSANDAELAAFLEEQFVRLIPGCEVFRTTRTGQILPGDEWFGVITEKLKEASNYLILITPNSVTRPWMWFEAGAGWMTGRSVVPVTVAIPKGEVPEPLRFFQIYALEDGPEAAAVFAKLGGALTDHAMFASAVSNLAARIREQVDADSGWEGFDFGRHFIAWEGPLHLYAQAADIGVPAGLVEALNKRGRRQTFAMPNDMSSALYKGYQQLWAVERKWKRRHALIEKDGQVLLTRPEPSSQGG